MAEAIFKVPTANAAKISALTSDDVVSRQSIVTRDAGALGVGANALYVRISGTENGIARAKQLVAEQKLGDLLKPADAKRVADAIDKEEESATSGMGLIDF